MGTYELVSLTDSEAHVPVPRPSSPYEIDLAVFRPLIERAQQGDMDALGEAWRTAIPVARSAIRKTIDASSADIDDLVQDTAFKVTGKIDTFDNDNFLGWVTTIAKNTAIDYLRTTTVRDVADPERRVLRSTPVDTTMLAPALDAAFMKDATTVPSPAVSAERVDSNQRVTEVLGLLPEDMREIVMDIRIKGYTYDEYAERKGIPVRSVKSRLHRALVKLRTLTESGILDISEDHGSLEVSKSHKEMLARQAAVEASLREQAAKQQKTPRNKINPPVYTARVIAALDQLPPKQRRAIQAIDLGGLSTREYAEHMNIGQSAAANAVARGRVRLHQIAAAENL